MSGGGAIAEILRRGGEPQSPEGWGSRIHRHVEPRGWVKALEQVPDEHRAGAELYLRGIAARMRVALAARAEREASGRRRR